MRAAPLMIEIETGHPTTNGGGPLSCQVHSRSSLPNVTPRGIRSARGPAPAENRILSARGKKLFWTSFSELTGASTPSIPEIAITEETPVTIAESSKPQKAKASKKRPLIHRSYGILAFNRAQHDKTDLNYLLIKDWRGDFGFPKGYGNKGEHKIAAAKREFQVCCACYNS